MVTAAGPEEAIEEGDDEHLIEMLSKPHRAFAQVMLRSREALWAMNLLDMQAQVLGSGRFGVAYKIDVGTGPTVLKVTRDPYEAITSYRLQGQKTSRVVPVYKVWQCGNCQPWGDDGLGWFIVYRALLNPVSKRDAKILDLIYDLYLDEDQDLWIPEPGNGGRAMRAKWKRFIDEAYATGHDEDSRGGGGQSAARAMAILQDVSVGAAELRKHGIDWGDCHSDNMMRDDKGVLRISDIGWGMPERDAEIIPPDFTVDAVKEYLSTLGKPQ